jgi:hypothetical protein
MSTLGPTEDMIHGTGIDDVGSTTRQIDADHSGFLGRFSFEPPCGS